MKLYFLFNKNTQVVIGMSLDPKSISGSTLFRAVEIDDNENLANLEWEGDYSNGKLIKKNDKNALVTEMDIISKFYDRFYRRYTVESVFKAMMLQFSKMISEGDLDRDNLDPEFRDMMEFFRKNYIQLGKEQKFFEESEVHDFQSKEQMENHIKDQFKV